MAWEFDPEEIAERGGRLIDGIGPLRRRLMLTIDGVEDNIYGWERRAREAGYDINAVDIVRHFCKQGHGARESVFRSIERRPSTVAEAMVDQDELADLLGAWRSR